MNPILTPDFFDMIEQKSFFFILNHISFILASFCMIGVVSTFNYLGRDENKGMLLTDNDLLKSHCHRQNFMLIASKNFAAI